MSDGIMGREGSRCNRGTATPGTGGGSGGGGTGGKSSGAGKAMCLVLLVLPTHSIGAAGDGAFGSTTSASVDGRP